MCAPSPSVYVDKGWKQQCPDPVRVKTLITLTLVCNGWQFTTTELESEG